MCDEINLKSFIEGMQTPRGLVCNHAVGERGPLGEHGLSNRISDDKLRNVHDYDRQLTITGVPPSTPQERDLILRDDKFLHRLHKDARSMSHLILTEEDKNMDPVNQCNALDLYVALYKKLKQDDDLFPLFEEQLRDMFHLGRCPQGRVIRLWQVFQSLQN